MFLAISSIGMFPSVEGHPAGLAKGQSSSVRSQSMGKKPYWINACSMGTANASGDKSSSGSLTPADKDTIDSIYMTALQGIVHANRFRNDYVSDYLFLHFGTAF